MDIVKPVHEPTNPRKHRTRNSNLRARLKLKQNDDCLSEELQSSVRPGPRCGPVGGRRLKSGLFNRYVIVGISEAFGVAIKKSHVRWHMIVLSIIALHHAQSVADSSSRKNREKDATGSRKKVWVTFAVLEWVRPVLGSTPVIPSFQVLMSSHFLSICTGFYGVRPVKYRFDHFSKIVKGPFRGGWPGATQSPNGAKLCRHVEES
jgi:hypothetical protein